MTMLSYLLVGLEVSRRCEKVSAKRSILSARLVKALHQGEQHGELDGHGAEMIA